MTVVNITKIIRSRSFYTEYQPLRKTSGETTFAYEAFIRTQEGLNPESIFNYGREQGLLYEFDTASIRNAIQGYPTSYFEKFLLFVNIFPSTLVHPNFPDFLNLILQVNPKVKGRVVFEINETPIEQDYWDLAIFEERLTLLNSLKFKIALDDIPLINLPIYYFLKHKPDFIKLDRTFSESLAQSVEKQETISFLLSYLDKKTIVVLEGIETERDLIKALELGVPLLQGYYIGKPHRLDS